MDDDVISTWIQVFAVTSIVFGGLFLLCATALFILGSVVASIEPTAPGALFFGIGAGLFAVGILYLWTGVGVLRRRTYARPLGLVTSALSLLSFPLGTAYGVLGIWLLAFEKRAYSEFD